MAQDRSLKLWDLRGGTAGPASQPRLLHNFGGYKHAVSGVTVHLGTAVSCSRGKVALTPLAPPYAPEVGYADVMVRVYTPTVEDSGISNILWLDTVVCLHGKPAENL